MVKFRNAAMHVSRQMASRMNPRTNAYGMCNAADNVSRANATFCPFSHRSYCGFDATAGISRVAVRVH